MRHCFVCSQQHWHHSRLVGPALDPTQNCIHRETELVLWERRQEIEARKEKENERTAIAGNAASR